MDTTTDKMRRSAERFRRRVDEIRRDWTRSDEAKRQDLEAAFAEARSTHSQLADEVRAEVRGRVETARKAAFAPPKIAGSEKAMELLAYRSALDAVTRIDKSTDLANLLERAEITGDTPLARACLYRGYELQSEALVGSYLEKYPDELPVWEKFMGAAQELNTLETLGITAAAGVPEPERPQELGRAFAVTSSRGTPDPEAT
jgi:hypothetical protein